MAVMPKVQLTRDAAITNAVNTNGNHAGWVNVIKTAVDAHSPIVILPPFIGENGYKLTMKK